MGGTLFCDVCKDYSGDIQPDKTFYKRCMDGSREINGEYPDLASCQAAGGKTLTDMKCNYMYQLGMSPQYADAQQCKQAASYGPRCCGGQFTGTLACDICVPP